MAGGAHPSSHAATDTPTRRDDELASSGEDLIALEEESETVGVGAELATWGEKGIGSSVQTLMCPHQ